MATFPWKVGTAIFSNITFICFWLFWLLLNRTHSSCLGADEHYIGKSKFVDSIFFNSQCETFYLCTILSFCICTNNCLNFMSNFMSNIFIAQMCLFSSFSISWSLVFVTFCSFLCFDTVGHQEGHLACKN